MALEVKAGYFQDGASTTAVNTGFEPKIVLLTTSYATSINNSVNDASISFGACVDVDSTLQQTSVTCCSEDDDKGDAAQFSTQRFGDGTLGRAIVYSSPFGDDGAITLDGRINSFDSTGFDFDSTGNNVYFGYLAIGGSNITNVAMEKVTCPASTGVVGYSGAGFTPDFIIAYGTDISGDSGTLAGTARMSVGFGDGTGTSQQYTSNYSVTDALNSTRQQTNDSIINIPSRVEANIDAFHSKGIDLNWTTRSATGGQFTLIYIKGGSFSIGDSTQRTSVGTTLTGDTGLTTDPIGIFAMGTKGTSAFGTLENDAHMNIGFASGTDSTDHASAACTDADTDDGDDGRGHRTFRGDSVISFIDQNTTTTLARAHVNSYDATDGVELDWTVTNGAASKFSFFTLHDEVPSINETGSGGAVASGEAVVFPEVGSVTMVAGDATSDDTSGGTAWTNFSTITTNDGTNAIADNVPEETEILKAFDFGFDMSGVKYITGIEVHVEHEASDTNCSGAGRRINDVTASLLKNKSFDGTNLAETYTPMPGDCDRWHGSSTVVTYGGPGVLWDSTWSPADIESTGFGFGLVAAANKGEGDEDAEVDYIEIVVYYQNENNTPDTFDETGAGGAEAGGAAEEYKGWHEFASGGAEVAGEASSTLIASPTPSGGAEAGGASLLSDYLFAQGGAVVGGSYQLYTMLTPDGDGTNEGGWSGSYTDIDEHIENADDTSTMVVAGSNSDDKNIVFTLSDVPNDFGYLQSARLISRARDVSGKNEDWEAEATIIDNDGSSITNTIDFGSSSSWVTANQAFSVTGTLGKGTWNNASIRIYSNGDLDQGDEGEGEITVLDVWVAYTSDTYVQSETATGGATCSGTAIHNRAGFREFVLHPNGTGTNNGASVVGAATLHAATDEGVDYVDTSDYLRIADVSGAQAFLLLDDTPEFFYQAISAVVRVHSQENSDKGDDAEITVQLFESDESTALTSKSSVFSPSSWTTTEYSLSITGTNDKTTWDGARIHVDEFDVESGYHEVAAIEVVIEGNYAWVDDGTGGAVCGGEANLSSGGTYNETGAGGGEVAGDALESFVYTLIAPGDDVGAKSQGPSYPSDGSSTGTGQVLWMNTSNITSSNDSRADAGTMDADSGDMTNWLTAKNFGFSIPADSTIDGISVDVEGFADRDDILHENLVAIKDGTIREDGTDLAAIAGYPDFSEDVDEVVSFGPSLFNLTWSPSDIDATNFGVALRVQHDNDHYDSDVYVDSIALTVNYTVPGSGVRASGSSSSEIIVGTSGGAVLGGTISFDFTFNVETSGGGVLSGAASGYSADATTYNEIASGGAVASGESFNEIVGSYDEIAEGGAVASGIGDVSVGGTFDEVANGGAVVGGIGHQTYNENGTGGSEAAGSAFTTFDEVGIGGSVVSGLATGDAKTVTEMGSGGALVQPIAHVANTDSRYPSGGIVAAGLAIHNNTLNDAFSGGGEVGGSVFERYFIETGAEGGLHLGGDGVESFVYNINNVTSSGGMEAGGQALEIYCPTAGPSTVYDLKTSKNVTNDVDLSGPTICAPFTNLSDATSSDDQYAKAFMDATCQESGWIIFTGFDFNLNTNSDVDGFEVKVERRADANASEVYDDEIRLHKAGTGVVGDNKAASEKWGGSDQDINYGSATDLWGTSGWTVDQIEDPDFGVAIKVQNTGSKAVEAWIDSVRMIVWSSGGLLGCQHNVNGEGGIVCGGFANGGDGVIAKGGILCGGEVVPTGGLGIVIATGGATTEGHAPEQFVFNTPSFDGFPEAGVEASGTAFVQVIINPVEEIDFTLGGAMVGGTILNELNDSFAYDEEAQGGASVAPAATGNFQIPIGGASISGFASTEYDEIASGGITLGGLSLNDAAQKIIGGGAESAGESFTSFNYSNIDGAGGIELGGIAIAEIPPNRTYDVEADGGIDAKGTSFVQTIRHEFQKNGRFGVTPSGTADNVRIALGIVSGGATTSGEPFNQFVYANIDSTGGATTGGISPITENAFGSGGAEVSGYLEPDGHIFYQELQQNPTAVTAGGEATNFVRADKVIEGGATLGGRALTKYDEIMDGGITVGGAANQIYIETTSGGVTIGGEADEISFRNGLTTGGATLGGQAIRLDFYFSRLAFGGILAGNIRDTAKVELIKSEITSVNAPTGTSRMLESENIGKELEEELEVVPEEVRTTVGEPTPISDEDAARADTQNEWCDVEVQCDEGGVPKVVQRRQTDLPPSELEAGD